MLEHKKKIAKKFLRLGCCHKTASEINFSVNISYLSPKELKALQRYIPASLRLGFLILKVSKNRFFLPFLHSQVILESCAMTLSLRYQVISGKGLASKMHSRMRSSPSCLILGFLGNRGGMPSGNFGFSPGVPKKKKKINIFLTLFQFSIIYNFYQS